MTPGASFKPLIAKVATGAPMSEAEARDAFELMMSGDATPTQIGGFLMALRVRGETVDEISGAVATMRAKAHMIAAPPGAIDTCGTGGDAKGTHNVSTAAALVLAGCGVPVAKHGNRALSSKSGSADVLTALGVNLDAPFERIEQAIADAGIGFMMAPRHHGAMRHVGPSRVELGTRTIFNLLGPLSNPAGVKRQVVGIFAPEWLDPVATALGRLGAERAWVVHGADGLDELSTTGPSHVAEWDGTAVRRFQVSPADAGLDTVPLEALLGGDAETNAAAIRDVLAGRPGPLRDIVLLNAAAGLIVAGRVDTLRGGVDLAAAAIDDGRAAQALARLAEITQGTAR